MHNALPRRRLRLLQAVGLIHRQGASTVDGCGYSSAARSSVLCLLVKSKDRARRRRGGGALVDELVELQLVEHRASATLSAI